MFSPLPLLILIPNTAEETLITMQSKYSKVDVAVLMAVAVWGDVDARGYVCVCVSGIIQMFIFFGFRWVWNNEHVTWMHFLVVIIFCVTFCHEILQLVWGLVVYMLPFPTTIEKL